MPVCFASKLCKILICLCVLMLLVVGKGTYRNHGQPPVKHARKFCYLIPLGFIFMRLGFLLWEFRLVFPFHHWVDFCNHSFCFYIIGHINK